MKVIFLDIDGCLNTYKSLEDGIILIPEKVRMVEKLCNETSSGIVITSSWRHRYSVSEIKRLFKDNGWEGEVPIIGMTDTKFSEDSRGKHIKRYKKEHSELGIDGYVIIDDRHEESFGNNQLKRFVKINPIKGITLADFYRAKVILG